MSPHKFRPDQEITLNDFLREGTLQKTNAYQMKIAFDTLWLVLQNGIKPILHL